MKTARRLPACITGKRIGLRASGSPFVITKTASKPETCWFELHSAVT